MGNFHGMIICAHVLLNVSPNWDIGILVIFSCILGYIVTSSEFFESVCLGRTWAYAGDL